jgi:hypothetical protein
MRRAGAILAALVAGIALLFPVPAAAQPSPRDIALADLERQRAELARRFDLAREHVRLDRYVGLIEGALGGPALLRQAPIDRLPFVITDRLELLRRVSALAAERLGIPLDGVTVRYSRLPADVAGHVTMSGRRANVEVSDRYRDDDEQVMIVAAHEFAHIALAGGGPDVDDTDEDLVDAAVVMVGLGPLLLRASYREGLEMRGGRATWSVRRTGSLNPVGMAYLILVQAERAGVGEAARRPLLGLWAEPAWSFRTRQDPTARILPVQDGREAGRAR